MYKGSDVQTKAAIVDTLNSVISTLETDGIKALDTIKADRDAMQSELANNQYELVLILDGQELHKMDILGKSEINIKDVARNSAKVFSNFASRMTNIKWTETEKGFSRDYGNDTKMILTRKS